ncbi:condensation domain-containing protein [Clostridium tagluense]|uniref:condensation domain-containing protein n=1 Tax=Clostridium tagluense TaxID=360422 RepID=UPI001CF10EAA|nr:condensation domain-containing protein [Clostridium tagluense]MCB2311584.1 condensation domain-containing protein [Clostridium tagluense]MCB2316308.1 condensation domain-containing protein [Clostridium tagluense]MCB2321163.1 condensation domain-containing protein [Clostridium tagluense]MCB2326177.1 condensation domain-containing protein [Clostridium tagluense]MCB2330900.1 condensation domain-containing protein [Clostridium tagluense]
MENNDNVLLSTKKYKIQRDFWLNMLKDMEIDHIIKPNNNISNEVKSLINCEEIGYLLDGKISNKVLKISKSSDITLYIVLLSAFICTLNKYSGKEDIYVGIPVYEENGDNLFNNSLVLRKLITKQITFKQVLIDVKDEFVKICDNQDYPFEKVLEEVNIDKDISCNIFQNLIVASENIHNIEKVKSIKNNNLLVTFNKREENIEFKLFYNKEYYDLEMMRRLFSAFNRLLMQVVDNPDINIHEIDILPQEEKNKILFDFNNTKIEYEKDKTIHQIFEEQVKKNPDNIAVVYEDEQLTFRELNRKANNLAHILRKKGAKQDTIIGLMVDRSVEMIIGILGILKAGGAYFPVDYNLPQERILSMLNDGEVKIILTKSNVIDMKSFTSLQGLNTAEAKPYKTQLREPIVNLDELSIINRSLVDYEKYHKHIGLTMVKSGITLQATRGCPYDCSYCHKIWSKKHVVRSAENIYSEIKIYYDMGVRRFSFIDDIFNLDVENSSRFFRLIIENNMDIQIFFPAGLRGDILTKDYIDLMIKAGTVNIAVALETGSPRIQKLINKNLNIEKLFENIKYIGEKYPHVVTELFTMHGFPTETKEEALLTLDFIKKIKWLHFPYVHILKIYNNTEMEQLALKSGISPDAIARSMELAWQELPETLPFDKSFTIQYQSKFLNDYFMLKERLISVLPHQMKIMTESELVEKYTSYMPFDIKTLDELLNLTGITREELGSSKCLEESSLIIPDLNNKIKKHFSSHVTNGNELKILFLDLSQYFEGETNSHYDPIEPPLGYMYLLSYLNSKLGNKIKGKIAKSRVDFANYDELKNLIEEFKPDVIGVRSLNYYRNFFHKTISIMREWGIDVPIIAGGPYATSMYTEVLRDKNIDLVSIGEGEYTFLEILTKIIEAKGKMPNDEILKDINGIAYIPNKQENIEKFGREIIMLDSLDDKVPSEYDDNLECINKSTDLAYTIFTSGSTGIPKGILIEHNNVTNLILGLSERVYSRYNQNLNVALVAPYVFDASVQQIFASLLLGHTLYIVPDSARGNGEELIKYYVKNKIDISDGTPTHIALMLEGNKDDVLMLGVKHFIIGGEALPLAFVKRFLNLFKEDSPIITNVYGPTECCVDSTSYDIYKDVIDNLREIPIGSPMPNGRIYIISNDEQLLPIGVEGEICIAGDGVARGYLKRDELTLERFINNPLIPNEKIYKTGDTGKWLENGNLYFMDRIDNQVKIRGYRIELGEIQNQLLRHPEIMEAVVVVREDGESSDLSNKYLCAYIVFRKEIDPIEIRKFLLFNLPDYMIPQYFVPMKRLPKTYNGKLDKSSLLNPKILELNNWNNLMEARTPIEAKLVDCYKKVLGREKLGINENFFVIGGDSIKTIQIISRMKKDGFKLEMNDIFQHPTIQELAPYVKQIEHVCDQSSITGNVPLTPIQREFFSGSNIDMNHFNQSVMLFLPKRLSEELVKAIFSKLQEHHDALRMNFKTNDGQIIQVCEGLELPVSLKVFELENEENVSDVFKSKVNEIQGSINLESGPLMNLGLFHLDDGDRLLIVIHHLVVDGVSWRILFEDIETLYQQYVRGENLVLPLKTDSYKEWAERLIQYSKNEEILKEKQYWSDIVRKLESMPMISKDYDGDYDYYLKDREVLSINLSEEETNKLLNNTNQAFGTEINDILLTALALSGNETFGNSKILVELEGHGREQIINNIDISRTVGWFTSLFPVLLDVSYKDNLSRQIKEVKENLRKVPNKGIGYNILKNLLGRENIMELNLNYIPQVCFNYLGQFDAEINKSSFKASDEYAGNTQSQNRQAKYEIEINAMIAYNRFKISISYSKNQYKYETINSFLTNYKAKLCNIISLCIAHKDIEISPSDLGFKNLSIEQLENFF